MSYLVSVIITAYNQEGFIEQAIDSVLEQNHKEFECIISDDGSDDRTLGEFVKQSIVKTNRLGLLHKKMQAQAQMGLVIYLMILNI